MDYSQYPTNRKDAKVQGAKYYFTGEPCINGHITLRKTKGACVACIRLEAQKCKDKRAEYFAEYNKSEAGQAAKRAYYERNRDKVIAKAQARSAEQTRTYKQRYKDRNPEVYKLLTNTRRRRLRDATPKCITAQHRADIKAVYKQALEMNKTSSVKYEVDHIIPLLSDTVCGLHVPWNLQILPKAVNARKSNKYA